MRLTTKFFDTLISPQAPHQRRRRQIKSIQSQALEARTLLAANPILGTAVISNNQLQVTLHDLSESTRNSVRFIPGDLNVVVSFADLNRSEIREQTVTFSNEQFSQISSLTVNGSSQSDVINLRQLPQRRMPRLALVSIAAGAGNDRVIGSSLVDIIRGNAGNDYIDGGAGNDRLFGFDGDDVLVGGTGNDSLQGDAGSDTLDGLSGTDSLDGGTGHDVLQGSQSKLSYQVSDTFSAYATQIKVGRETDRLQGTFSELTVRTGTERSADAAALRVDVSNWTHSGVRIETNNGADTIIGSAQADTILSWDGDDVITAGDGNDSVNGGNGHSTIYGGAGDDDISMYGDSSLIVGGPGNDSLTGTSDADTIRGSDGNDTIRGNGGDDSLDGGPNDDQMFGGSGDDLLRGGSGNDILQGEDGTDTLDGLEGNDSLGGGADRDVLKDRDGFVWHEIALDREISLARDGFRLGSDGIATGVFTENSAQSDQVLGEIRSVVIETRDRGSNVDLQQFPWHVTTRLGTTDRQTMPASGTTLNAAHDDFYLATLDASVAISQVDGLLKNDITGINYYGTTKLVTGTSHGEVTLNEDGSFIYKPDAGYAGSDRFTYQLHAFGQVSNIAMVSLQVRENPIQIVDNTLRISLTEASDFVIRTRPRPSMTPLDELLRSQLGSLADSEAIESMRVFPLQVRQAQGFFERVVARSRASRIESIDITGSDEADFIDLSWVNANTFPRLRHVSVRGLGGNDTIVGSALDDILQGGDGDDLVSSSSGRDRILGDSGNDALLTASDSGSLVGGSGDDALFYLAPNAANGTIDASDGRDFVFAASGTLNIRSNAQTQLAIAGLENAKLTDGQIADNGRLIQFRGGAELIMLAGSATPNRLDASDSPYPVILQAIGVGDTLIGSAFDDVLNSEGGGAVLNGGAGNDLLISGNGIDTVTGGAGTDQLAATPGSDVIDTPDEVIPAFADSDSRTESIRQRAGTLLDKLGRLTDLIFGKYRRFD